MKGSEKNPEVKVNLEKLGGSPINVRRGKVPDGWILIFQTYYRTEMEGKEVTLMEMTSCMYYDPEHAWDGNIG